MVLDIGSEGVKLIAAERVRQLTQEGYTPEHDDQHGSREILMAAFCYLGDLINGPHAEPSSLWPWERHAWKPTPNDRVRQMVKAAALIAAEIDRLEGWACVCGHPYSKHTGRENGCDAAWPASTKDGYQGCGCLAFTLKGG